MEEFSKFVIAFMGGGIISGFISWARITRSEKTSRKAEYLQNQIDNLYGPLYYFTSQNEQLFELNKNIMEAYNIEYVDQKWSNDPTTTKSIKSESHLTINIANSYVQVVIENNERITNILQNNSKFIDPEDNKEFQSFAIDNLRLKVEKDENGTLITPFMIYEKVGEISFMRGKFKDLVRAKFNSKVNEIKEMH